MKTKSIATLGVALWAVTSNGEERVREIDWLPQPFLHVANKEPTEARTRLFVLERPGVTRATYAIRGEVRYEGIEGTAYLEMWSYFPEGAFFSRTLADQGPMQKLTGSSNWRSFTLPFFNKEGAPPPSKLEVNVVFPGKGSVDVARVRLVQFKSGENPLANEGDRAAVFGGVAGSLLGLLGGLVGLLADRAAVFGGVAGSLLGLLGGLVGLLAARGKARGFVLAALKGMMAFGLASLILGAAALVRREPTSLVYPLLLIGTIATLVPVSSLGALRKRYEEIELRRLKAFDVPS